MAKRYAVYKGLQRPLIFKGFKGKFIYWGVGALLLGLVAGSIIMALVNMYVGAIALIGLIVGGLFYTAGKQKGGLHDKTQAKGIYIHQTGLTNLKSYGTEERI
ncbi:plasmid transfer protein [Pedobacter sp. ISL-68]|uniref:plasmid transfer protein n=1 Tax=unclassified Pedobacter TaxID=2628915 RepID=UPI001BEC334E|nr:MULTISPECIES: plasmid transfer protein [unclassified Pedobacter]MBT2560122.1 plasmid transfer protein [Pedobacter sp. ISL-64]MBT2589101.1 plasmid transfer protein [Pedobacter sp. ISL-68]